MLSPCSYCDAVALYLGDGTDGDSYCERHKRKAPGRVSPILYGVEDVAAAAGIAGGTVRSYLAREQMPAPSGSVGRSPYWWPGDIAEWVARRA